MRLPRQFKKKRFFIILAVILAFILIFFLGHKVLTENKIGLFEIDAQNLNCTNQDEIKNFLASLNLNYFYLKKESVEEKLRQKFYCIGRIDSEISYPDKYKLKIAGREAKFVVRSIDAQVDANPKVELDLNELNATQSTTEAFPPKVLSRILDTYKESSASAMYLVDEEGMVFEELSSDVNFPRLSIFSQDLKIGTKLPEGLIKKITQVGNKLKELDSFSDNLLVVGDKLIIDSKPRIIFSLNGALDRQSASLQLILAQAKMNLDPDSRDVRFVESIDLRFDRPVVVYRNQ